MKWLFSLCLILFFCLTGNAQLPEDALRLSWTTPSGTARQQAIGGAMGSLGGEISTIYVNPAGLGFYKTREFVLSPGFRFQSDKANYGTETKGPDQHNFNLGTSGLVFGSTLSNNQSLAFSIAVNKTADFSSNISYQGNNKVSSFSEQYAEEFAASGLSIDDGIISSQLSYGTRMALYTYLVDTATINGVTQVIGQPQKVLWANGSLHQSNNLHSTGGVTEIAAAVAGSLHDKWFVGATVGIPVVNYHRDQTFTETDASGNTDNDFASAVYHESYSSKGVGVNIKLGIIYKPSASVRAGLAIHTPSFYSLTDKVNASMAVNTENYAGSDSISSSMLDQGSGTDNSIQYRLNSPWRIILSGSYIFGGQENVKQQKGFISGDIEYVTNKSARFNQPADDQGYSDPDYYKSLNSVVKSYYQNSLNFRLGGELKFNMLAARAGAAYYMTPYSENAFKANKLLLSGGLGYRNKGIFVDLTYVETLTKDINFPYRLADKTANSYATIKQAAGTVILSIGIKF